MSSTPPDSTEPPGQEQGFLSHLIELRQRLVRSALAVLIIFLPLTFFMKDIFDLLSRPLMVALPAGTKLLATGVIAPFMVPLKVTLFVSFLLALPFVLWQAWAFVAPGLYRHEKRLAGPIIVSSVFMFMLGIAYCYFVVFGFVFKFIAGFAPESVNVAPDIEAYFSFVLGMFLAFGITFEVPIIVVAFILAAIFTPPDVLSQLLLAIPLCLLYELGIFCARFVQRPASTEEKAAA
jgi:sec-independent protein translocase protein TatC